MVHISNGSDQSPMRLPLEIVNANERKSVSKVVSASDGKKRKASVADVDDECERYICML